MINEYVMYAEPWECFVMELQVFPAVSGDNRQIQS
jgi:hypothetical protein